MCGEGAAGCKGEEGENKTCVFCLNRSDATKSHKPPGGISYVTPVRLGGGGGGVGGLYVKLQAIIDPGDILQHLTFTLAGRDMKSFIECVLLCSSLVTSLINSFPPSLPAH